MTSEQRPPLNNDHYFWGPQSGRFTKVWLKGFWHIDFSQWKQLNEIDKCELVIDKIIEKIKLERIFLHSKYSYSEAKIEAKNQKKIVC